VTDYAIYWNDGAGTIFSEKVASTGLIDPLEYTFTGADVDPDKDYQVQIKARNAVGLSASSSSLLIISA